MSRRLAAKLAPTPLPGLLWGTVASAASGTATVVVCGQTMLGVPYLGPTPQSGSRAVLVHNPTDGDLYIIAASAVTIAQADVSGLSDTLAGIYAVTNDSQARIAALESYNLQHP